MMSVELISYGVAIGIVAAICKVYWDGFVTPSLQCEQEGHSITSYGTCVRCHEQVKELKK